MDSSILIVITLGVLGLRVASWVYLWLTHRTQPKPEQKEAKSATNLSTLLNIVLGLIRFYMFAKKTPKSWSAKMSSLLELFESTENPLFESYLDKVTSRGNIYTNRPGVDVSFRFYNDTNDLWFDLGTSPVEQVRLPYTYLQLKFKEGNQEHTTWAHPYYILREATSSSCLPWKRLKPPETAKSDHFDHVEYGPFDIAKREVTNAEFLEFVQQGGYNTDEGWDCPIEYQGRTLECDELRSMLVDETDMPGPSNWSYGKPPRGQEDYPVSGVSRFEAMAFAHFKGMTLPTVHQWASVASLGSASRFVPESNFSKNQLQNVGDSITLNPQGLFDIAGNVREWAYNRASGDDRAILGGCYLDDDYSFNDYFSQDALDRSLGNGFRLAKTLDADNPYTASFAPIYVEERVQVASQSQRRRLRHLPQEV